MLTLTKKQRDILDLIQNFIKSNREAPSLTELQHALQLKNKRSVVQYLDALEKKGYIVRSSRARGISLVKKQFNEKVISVPILGYANAGEPLIFAIEDRLGEIQVERELLPKRDNVFAVVLKGDSMNRRIINGTYLSNGNYAIVMKDGEVCDNDVVLAIINNCATVKAVKKSGQMIVLYPQSSNPVHKPIYLHKDSEVYINGKVITILENPLH